MVSRTGPESIAAILCLVHMAAYFAGRAEHSAISVSIFAATLLICAAINRLIRAVERLEKERAND